MKKPTQAQLELAKKLNLDLPEGASRSTASELINHALLQKQRGRTGEQHIPNEVAERLSGAFAGPSLTQQAYRAKGLALMRASGISVGSLVVDQDSGSPDRHCVVISFNADGAVLRTLDMKLVSNVQLTPHTDRNRLRLALLYTPAKGFAHPAFLKSTYPIKTLTIAEWTESIRARLPSEDRYTHQEYGELWRISAVEHMVAEMSRKPSKVDPQPPTPALMTFCVCCGAHGVLSASPRLLDHRCTGCRTKDTVIPKKGRFCVQCGSAFDARGPNTQRCQTCHPAP